jgi:DNA repair exonuclease SbcCD nuclease subunit
MKYLFTSDWHLRLDIPACRDETFLDTQEKTLEFIYETAKKHKAKVIIAGDLFHRANPDRSSDLTVLALKYLKRADTYLIAGNHDLKYHKIDHLQSGCIGVIWEADVLEKELNNFSFYHFSQELEKGKTGICVMHRYCEPSNLPEYIEDGISAETLFAEYDFDVFVVGDNHTFFVSEKDNRFVFNTGSITRQSASQKYTTPKCVIYDDITNTYEIIELPDNNPDDVITDHIQEKTTREDRISSFVEKLKGSVDLDLSFESNLDMYIKKNKVKESVKNKIYDCI